jgi:hypothetical protein
MIYQMQCSRALGLRRDESRSEDYICRIIDTLWLFQLEHKAKGHTCFMSSQQSRAICLVRCFSHSNSCSASDIDQREHQVRFPQRLCSPWGSVVAVMVSFRLSYCDGTVAALGVIFTPPLAATVASGRPQLVQVWFVSLH